MQADVKALSNAGCVQFYLLEHRLKASKRAASNDSSAQAVAFGSLDLDELVTAWCLSSFAYYLGTFSCLRVHWPSLQYIN